jgi:hypothetical protein
MQVLEKNTSHAVLFALAILMTATRFHHVGSALHLPDASMAVFFLGGLHVRRHWAFIALLVLAVAIDWGAMASSGRDFWSHYCVTPAYWLLPLAYAALWYAGRWAAYRWRWDLRGLSMLGAVALAAASLSFAISNGAFYWLGGRYPDPNFSEYLARVWRWGPLFVRTSLAYVALAVMVHAALAWAMRLRARPASDALERRT